MRFSFKKYALLTAAILLAGRASVSLAQETGEPAAASADAGAEKHLNAREARKLAKFDYQLDNRPDPFYPFITKEAKEKAEDDKLIDDVGKPLTGMQLFEPGQLRLVAVMEIQGSKIAMAEDMTGKGYVLRENMLIGKYGQIVQIEDGKVIIHETRRTHAGREISNEIVMTIKKEEKK